MTLTRRSLVSTIAVNDATFLVNSMAQVWSSRRYETAGMLGFFRIVRDLEEPPAWALAGRSNARAERRP